MMKTLSQPAQATLPLQLIHELCTSTGKDLYQSIKQVCELFTDQPFEICSAPLSKPTFTLSIRLPLKAILTIRASSSLPLSTAIRGLVYQSVKRLDKLSNQELYKLLEVYTGCKPRAEAIYSDLRAEATKLLEDLI